MKNNRRNKLFFIEMLIKIGINREIGLFLYANLKREMGSTLKTLAFLTPESFAIE